MAENFHKSRHTGTYIDDQIEQVGKNTSSIAGLVDQLNKISIEKADKTQIPTSISDLVHDAALVYVGDKAPEDDKYDVWVYLSNDLKKSKIYSRTRDGAWIDTSPATYEMFKVGFRIEKLESGDTNVDCSEKLRDIRNAMDNEQLPIGYELDTHKTFLLQSFSPAYVLFSCVSKDEDGQSVTENIEYIENQGWVYSATPVSSDISGGVQEIYVGSGDMPEGYVLQIDPEGEGFDAPQENTFIITLRNNGGIITSDKTFDEMYEAAQLGVNIVAQLGEVFYRLAIVEPAILWFSMSYSVSSEGCIWTLTCNKLDDVNCTWSLQKTDLPTKEYVDNAIANTGGGSGGVSTLHVTITSEGGKYTSDYTIDEVYEAYMSGRPVVVHLGSDIYQPMSSGTMPTTMVFMTSSYNPYSPSIKYIHMNGVPGTNDTAIEVLTLSLMSMAEINDNFESLSSNINNSKPLIVQVHSYDAGDGVKAYAASHSFTDLQMPYRNGQFIVVIYQDKVYQLEKYTPGVEFMFSHFNSETNCVEKFGCLPNGWMPTSDIELATKEDVDNAAATLTINLLYSSSDGKYYSDATYYAIESAINTNALVRLLDTVTDSHLMCYLQGHTSSDFITFVGITIDNDLVTWAITETGECMRSVEKLATTKYIDNTILGGAW